MSEQNSELYSKAPNLFGLLGGEEQITFSEQFRLAPGKDSEDFGQEYGICRQDEELGFLTIYQNPDSIHYNGQVDLTLFQYMKNNQVDTEHTRSVGQQIILIYTSNGRLDGWEIPFP